MRPDTLCWHCCEPRLIVCARRSLLGRINAAAAMATVHAAVRKTVREADPARAALMGE